MKRQKAESIVITLRLKPQILGRGLDALMTYDPSFDPDNLADIVRKMFEIGLSALSSNLHPFETVSVKAADKLTALSNRIFVVNERLSSRPTGHLNQIQQMTPALERQKERDLNSLLSDYKVNKERHNNDCFEQNEDTFEPKQKPLTEKERLYHKIISSRETPPEPLWKNKPLEAESDPEKEYNPRVTKDTPTEEDFDLIMKEMAEKALKGELNND